jgi:hypothetical protein
MRLYAEGGLFPLEADEVHRARSHGGAIDTDGKARVLGKSPPLEAPQSRRPGEHFFHQLRACHQNRVDRHDDAGRHREAVGYDEACGHLPSWPRILRHGFVDQPDLLLTQQVTQDQTGGFVVPLDPPERETGMRIASSTIASSEPGANRATRA